MPIKKIIPICIIIICFLIVIINALPLSAPSSSVSVIKGQAIDIFINITNQNNYSLKDISIVGDSIVSTKIDLLSNETKPIKITLTTNTIGSLVKTYNIVGFSEINCSVLGSTETLINITTNGANPRDVEICRDSSIRYKNSYGNSIKLTIADFNINKTLSNGDSHVQTYPNLGISIYRVDPLIDIGTITITDLKQKVHNNADDGSFTLTITSSLQQTFLEIIPSKIDFNISHDEIVNSFLVIKNNGTILAENIRIFGDWFTFDKNNFDINPNGERAVNFAIAPGITSVDQTGKTYVKEIRVLSDNVPEMKLNITIFIKKTNVITGNISTSEYWVKRKEFCTAFPTAPDCITEPFIVFRDKNIYDCPAILANVSPKDVQESFQQCNNLQGDFNEFSNNVKLSVDGIEGTISNSVANKISEISENLKLNDVKIEGFRNTFYFIFGIGFLTALIGSTAYIAILFFKRRKGVVIKGL